MRITAPRILALPAAAVCAVALTGLTASGAAAATVTSGTVTLTVEASFLEQLAQHGVGFVPSGYSSLSYSAGTVSVSYVVSGGTADLSTFSGTLSADGGILGFDLRSGKTVDLNTLIFDLGDTQFDGQSSTSGGEVPLLDLAGTQAGSISGTSETYSATDLTVDAAGAAYLDGALGSSAFTAGQDVGSFSATWVL